MVGEDARLLQTWAIKQAASYEQGSPPDRDTG
jgi:hypothetical protein